MPPLAILGWVVIVGTSRSPLDAPRASGEPSETKVLEGHRSGVTGVQYSPDGQWLASGSLDGTVRIWSTSDWKLEHELAHGDEVYALVFSPDSDLVASSGLNRRVVIWDVASGSVHCVVPLPDWSLAMAFTQSGELIVGGESGRVRVVDPITGEVARTIEIGSEVLGLAVSPRGELLATSVPIQLRDFDSGKVVKRIAGHGQGGLAFSPGGELLASAEWTAGALVWSVATGRLAATLRLDVSKTALGPDGFTQITVNMEIETTREYH
jgi:WD40 repeat protein